MTTDRTFTATDGLSQQVARILHEEMKLVREELADELREQTRRQRRTARLYAGSAAAGLYGGGALVAFLVLLLGLGLPGWAAALVVGAVLVALSVVLRAAAKSSRGGTGGTRTGAGGAVGAMAADETKKDKEKRGKGEALVPGAPLVPPKPDTPPRGVRPEEEEEGQNPPASGPISRSGLDPRGR